MANLPKDHFTQAIRFTKTIYQDVYPSIDPTNPAISLEGRVAIITGASRGIGARGFAPAFAKAGAKGLVLLATNAEKLAAVESELHKINPKLETLVTTADITDPKAVEGLFAEIKQRWGHADVLINNAAAVKAMGDLHETDPDEWWANYEVNVKGPYLLTRAFLSLLPEPKSTPATILNINTTIAWQFAPSTAGYSTSKGALLNLTAHIAQSYPDVTAVSVYPGLVETDAMMDFFRPFDHEAVELVGGLAVWFAADPVRARFLSGRFVAASWSVDELVERKAEIEEGGLLMIDLVGKFGREQFGE